MKHDNDNHSGIRFLSVCSGIEAASVAWHPLGWRAVAFSEIEKFPSAVLAHHYPDVPNLGDFTKIDTAKLGRVDILAGGTPCQAFSVAGLRQSLADARGNLSLEFVRLAHELADGNGLRNVVWENVVGVLSTKDNALGCFLAGLVGADAPIEPPARGKWPRHGMVSGPKGRAAWAVKDAQFFGVAQRRRRVLVVADFGNGADPAAVLFEPEGVLRHPPARGEARKDVAAAVARSVALRGREGGGTAELGDEIAGTLRASSGGGDKPHALTFAPEIARCDATREGSSQDYETTTMVAVDVAPTMRAGGNSTGGDRPYGTDVDTCDSLAVVHAIQAGALRTNPNSGPDGVGVQEGIAYTLEARAEVQAVAFDWYASQSQSMPIKAISPPLKTTMQPAIAFHENQRAEVTLNDTAGALGVGGGKPGQGYPATLQGSAVRRLTPTECERLQGFPDGYTDIPWRGKPTSPDGPRYKALGNSWAVPKFVWLGKRLHRLLAANENTPAKEAA